MTFLYLFVAALNHAPDYYIGLRAEFVQLHPQMTGVLCGIDFRGFGWSWFLLDEFKCVGVREEGGEFLLKVVGLPGILVDVVLDGDLGEGMRTRYISLSCCTNSML